MADPRLGKLPNTDLRPDRTNRRASFESSSCVVVGTFTFEFSGTKDNFGGKLCIIVVT